MTLSPQVQVDVFVRNNVFFYSILFLHTYTASLLFIIMSIILLFFSRFNFPISIIVIHSSIPFITRRRKSMLYTNNAKYIWIRMTNVLNGFDRIGILRDKPFTIRRNVIGFLTILFGLVFSNIYGKGNWNS